MPATYTAAVLSSLIRMRLVDFDPDSADPALATLNPSASEKGIAIAAGGRRVLVKLMRSVGTGNVDAFEIIVAANAALTTNATVVAAHAAPTVANAVGDELTLEVDVEQMREVLAAATHWGVRVELATSTDECVIGFVEAEHQFPRAGLTADYIS